jgi:UDP-N-acetylmuramoyl-L-alanyl-D-glutamate--2,6-diaminopimelate ligase
LRKEKTFGTAFLCHTKSEKKHISLPLPGEFSVLNALAAVSVCLCFGVSLSACIGALADINIPGRFELVTSSRNDITCIVDYAHNGASLSAAVGALRPYAKGRIICLFGSVGGRTKERRRELGKAAASLADLCIVTSDNPDFEPPEEIIEEISAHIPAEKCCCITDRKEAVNYALDIAKRGDIIIFAGKGHENYQLINGKKLPFSERELIKNHIFKKDFIPFP